MNLYWGNSKVQKPMLVYPFLPAEMSLAAVGNGPDFSTSRWLSSSNFIISSSIISRSLILFITLRLAFPLGGNYGEVDCIHLFRSTFFSIFSSFFHFCILYFNVNCGVYFLFFITDFFFLGVVFFILPVLIFWSFFSSLLFPSLTFSFFIMYLHLFQLFWFFFNFIS